MIRMIVTTKRGYCCCFAALTETYQRGEISLSVSVMGGWVNHEPWRARWECILGGIGGLLEGGGLGWGCGGDVHVDVDQEEGCWWEIGG